MHGIRHVVRNRTNMLQRCAQTSHFAIFIAEFVLRAGNDIGGDVQSMNCPVDAVGGAVGSILGLALLVSIVVHIVALVIILCLYYGKIEWVANTNKTTPAVIPRD